MAPSRLNLRECCLAVPIDRQIKFPFVQFIATCLAPVDTSKLEQKARMLGRYLPRR
jgi:hypothetical protein